jgi:hypothetical protein
MYLVSFHEKKLLEQQKIEIDWQAQGFARNYSTTTEVTCSNKRTSLLRFLTDTRHG